jgi:hypothetical protein
MGRHERDAYVLPFLPSSFHALGLDPGCGEDRATQMCFRPESGERLSSWRVGRKRVPELAPRHWMQRQSTGQRRDLNSC